MMAKDYFRGNWIDSDETSRDNVGCGKSEPIKFSARSLRRPRGKEQKLLRVDIRFTLYVRVVLITSPLRFSRKLATIGKTKKPMRLYQFPQSVTIALRNSPPNAI